MLSRKEKNLGGNPDKLLNCYSSPLEFQATSGLGRKEHSLTQKFLFFIPGNSSLTAFLPKKTHAELGDSLQSQGQ